MTDEVVHAVLSRIAEAPCTLAELGSWAVAEGITKLVKPLSIRVWATKTSKRLEHYGLVKRMPVDIKSTRSHGQRRCNLVCSITPTGEEWLRASNQRKESDDPS